MISIIICSANSQLLTKALASIENTIGVAYETIIIHNPNAKLGICEAYNRGANQAAFSILCFVHEDVTFETKGWGRNVIRHLADPSVGLIGVAGGDTKSRVPSSWSSSVFQSEISIIQHFKFDALPPERIIETGYPDNYSLLKPAVCLDGVWLCTRKDVFAECPFDETLFKGFHGYDIDLSLQVFMKYKVGVVFDVLLHHYSEGRYDRIWLHNMMLVSRKWKSLLPLTVRDLSTEELKNQHWVCIQVCLDYFLQLNYKVPVILFYYVTYTANRFFCANRFWFYLRYILLPARRENG
ncbi:MAG: hypothetical protein INR73_28155 [Williamsia sp.]|nr:hypothetical protein [Williamsia sp.]